MRRSCCREGWWKGPAAAGAKGRGTSGTFTRVKLGGADSSPAPAAIFPAAQNTVCGPQQLARLCEAALDAMAREGKVGEMLAGDAAGPPSLGSSLVLYEGPGRRAAKPSRAARKFWEMFVAEGCLKRLQVQVHEFLKARNSPAELLPDSPWRVNLARYDDTGGEELAQFQGMNDHYDMTPHCAVSLSLTGDGGQPGLYWICHNERQDLALNAGDIAILARGVLHGVCKVARKGQRLVMVLFY